MKSISNFVVARLFEAYDTLNVRKIQGNQARILGHLAKFAREYEDAGHSLALAGERQREDIRSMCLAIMKYDRKLSNYERYVSRMGAKGLAPQVSQIVANIGTTNKRLRVLIDRVKEDEFALMDMILDAELREELQLEDALASMGPVSAGGRIRKLIKEVKSDAKALAVLNGKKSTTTYDKMKARERKLPALQNQYKIILSYLNHINKYYSEEIGIKAKLAELEGRMSAFDALERDLTVASGGWDFATPAKRTGVLAALRDLQYKRLAYNSDVAALNARIGQLNRTFSDLEKWYSQLSTKPKELVKAYQQASRMYYSLRTRSMSMDTKGLASVAQLIEKLESVGAYGV